MKSRADRKLMAFSPHFDGVRGVGNGHENPRVEGEEKRAAVNLEGPGKVP